MRPHLLVLVLFAALALYATVAATLPTCPFTFEMAIGLNATVPAGNTLERYYACEWSGELGPVYNSSLYARVEGTIDFWFWEIGSPSGYMEAWAGPLTFANTTCPQAYGKVDVPNPQKWVAYRIFDQKYGQHYQVAQGAFHGVYGYNVSVRAANDTDARVWVVAAGGPGNSGGGSQPSPPLLSVRAQVVNVSGWEVYGGLSVSGNVSGTLSFGGGFTSNALSQRFAAGSRYVETVPSSIQVTLRRTSTATAIGYNWPKPGGFTSVVVYSAEAYTGVFNVTGNWRLDSYSTGAVRVWLYACNAQGVCRQLYYSGLVWAGSGSFTVRNAQLNNEKLRFTLGYGYSSGGSVTVTLQNSTSTQATLPFAYWLRGSEKIYSTTATGTLSSDTILIAVYALRKEQNTAFVPLLPGMDFLPSNGTHFLPIAPGTYILQTNATVFLLDETREEFIVLEKGLNATLRVPAPYGTLAKVGSHTGSRTRSSTLPEVEGKPKLYLLSLAAPARANVTVYLKLNGSVYLYRVVVPSLEMLGVEYAEDLARILFRTDPPWDNYNVTAFLDDRPLTTAPASWGQLVVNYSFFEGLTGISTLEVCTTWGGTLKIANTCLAMPVIPVAVPLNFSEDSRAIMVSVGEPIVLGRSVPIRKVLAQFNESTQLGQVVLRLRQRSGGPVEWLLRLSCPSRGVIPAYERPRLVLEVIYVHSGSKVVLVVPWVERL